MRYENIYINYLAFILCMCLTRFFVVVVAFAIYFASFHLQSSLIQLLQSLSLYEGSAFCHLLDKYLCITWFIWIYVWNQIELSCERYNQCEYAHTTDGGIFLRDEYRNITTSVHIDPKYIVHWWCEQVCSLTQICCFFPDSHILIETSIGANVQIHE